MSAAITHMTKSVDPAGKVSDATVPIAISVMIAPHVVVHPAVFLGHFPIGLTGDTGLCANALAWIFHERS
jgi:hypothetical protein